MAATKADIEGWFDRGVKEGYKYMLVICDTFDYDDYPSYFNDESCARARINRKGDMQKVMECYDLQAPKEPQMNVGRMWALK